MRSPTDDKRLCSECRATKPADDFTWTYDRYGNPWRKVCGECFDAVEDEIAGWVFDAGDAGEALEPDDY